MVLSVKNGIVPLFVMNSVWLYYLEQRLSSELLILQMGIKYEMLYII